MKSPASALDAIALMGVCLLVQGCVGGWIQTRQAKTVDAPSVGDKLYAQPSYFPVYEAGSSRGAGSPTTNWLREHWGEPTSIRRASNRAQEEVWTYKRGRVSYGMVPCVIVPIPLILPLESRKVAFGVHEGRVFKARVVDYSKNEGWIAGLIPGGFGAASIPGR